MAKIKELILFDNINEIESKVIHFHKKENLVLVIFQNLNEIASVLYLLNKKGINIFDGKNEIMQPDMASRLKGAFLLGTNFCGHETDIKKPAKPFHAIVYDENFEIERKKKKKKTIIT